MTAVATNSWVIVGSIAAIVSALAAVGGFLAVYWQIREARKELSRAPSLTVGFLRKGFNELQTSCHLERIGQLNDQCGYVIQLHIWNAETATDAARDVGVNLTLPPHISEAASLREQDQIKYVRQPEDNLLAITFYGRPILVGQGVVIEFAVFAPKEMEEIQAHCRVMGSNFGLVEVGLTATLST